MNDIFDKIISREIPADIVYEDDMTIAFLDIRPVRKGHTLIVPKKECENIFDADPAVLAAMTITAQKIARAIMHTTEAKGVNLIMNNGHEAGQEVPHAHMHIIPRFARSEAFNPPVHETYEDGESAVLAGHIKTAIA